jgi:hypothetical protein
MYVEACSLQSESNQIQKIHKLAENDALCRSILRTKGAELFDQRLNLRRGPPIIEVQPSKNTLPGGRHIFFEF